MREIGKERASLESFTGIMGMLAPLSKPHFSSHTKAIRFVSTAERTRFLLLWRTCASLPRMMILLASKLSVMGHGLGVATKRFTVLLLLLGQRARLLTQVLSKYCAECHAKSGADTSSEDFFDWYEEHQVPCQVNPYSSSNTVEAGGAVVMWQRSIEKYKLRYTSVIADGNAKTYKVICDAKPYDQV